MGIFVFRLNLLTQNTVSGSILVQYFFQSAEKKFIVGSHQCMLFKKKKATPPNPIQTHKVFLNIWTIVREWEAIETCHSQTAPFWLQLYLATEFIFKKSVTLLG